MKHISVNQGEEFLGRSKKLKKEEGKKSPFIEMEGWVFGSASPLTRAWHWHRVVLACAPYDWVE